ncbi:MAG TPA: hypothetical protein H9732_09980 [Candidatus Mediterraneibacter avicola]|nr:hypothetical protein [Candidatus Mediterraneibacter avicola]
MGKQKITKKQKETIFIYRALSVRIFAFIMLLGGIVGIMFFFRPDTSEVEKRKLAEFPKPTLSSFLNGEYFYDLSLWYSDTYPMRDGLIAADQKIESLYGITPSTMMVGNRKISDDIPDIDEAQENSGNEQPQEVEQISAPDSRAMESEIQKQIQQNLYVKDGAAYSLYYYDQTAADIYTSALSKAAGELEGKTNVYSILVPNNSGAMLSDRELEALGGADQEQAIDYYYSLSEGVKTVDTIKTLREHNDEYLYFRTDHHWTQLAAYYVYQNFCEEKGIRPNELSDFQKMTFSPFLGTFYQELQNEDMAANPDFVDAYIPMATNDMTYWETDGSQVNWHVIQDVTGWNKNSLYSCFIGGDKPLVQINNPNLSDGSSCVVVKESYGNSFVPFLVDHYQTVYVIDFRYTKNNVMDFVQEHNVQDLIIINNISIIASENVAATIAGLLE